MERLTPAITSLDIDGLGFLAIICLVAAAIAVPLFDRAEAAKTNRARLTALVAGVLCLGVMIWGAHVATLSAIDAPYGAMVDIRMAGAALAVAIAMAGIGEAMLGGAGKPVLGACAGLALGAGAAAAHYVGIAGLRGPGRFILDPVVLAQAGLVAGVCAAAGFALASAAREALLKAIAALAVAASMILFHVIAINGLAVEPSLRPIEPAFAMPVGVVVHAAMTIGGLTLSLAGAALLVSNDVLAPRTAARDRAFADLTREGIVICDGVRIVDVNAAAARLLGLDAAMVRGRAFRDFVEGPDPDRILSASLAKSQEISLRATGGEGVFVEVSSRDLPMDGRDRRVFTLRDLSEQRRKEHQIRHLAYHDTLTGLANRAAFNEALPAALKRGGEVALFCVDLDRFKEVNDVYGHSAGDELLRTVAGRIVSAAPSAMTFRLGGDEFVVIGTGPDAGDADKLAIRLTERLNVEAVIAGRTMRSGASVGFAVYPHHGSDADSLFSNADAALYRAKADGRGLARGFEPEMDLALREKRALQQDLATAISRNEMFLHWMPQALAASGEIVGFEALVRWKHPTRGVVPPTVFIPVAEESAAIVPIGEWVLRTACRAAVDWPKPGKVAINLSPVQFQHGDIVNLVHSILLETGLPASRLELEITEGVLLDDLNGAVNTLRRLKALGVQIAMDDFGTGYSSLSYLQSFPFDRIKIDASFIRQLSTSAPAKAIIRAIVALGDAVGVPITAEGVETPEQRAFLAELRCEEIQGYLVGRPSPVVSFESPFARQRMRAAG